MLIDRRCIRNSLTRSLHGDTERGKKNGTLLYINFSISMERFTPGIGLVFHERCAHKSSFDVVRSHPFVGYEENLREKKTRKNRETISMIREDPRMQLTQLVAKLMAVALNQGPLLCRSSSLRKEDRGERSWRLVDVLRGSCTRSMDLLPRRNKFLSAT